MHAQLTVLIYLKKNKTKKKNKQQKKTKQNKKKTPEKAMQTRDFVSGLYINCLSNSPNTLLCLDQAMQTRKTFSIAVKIARYLVYKMSLVLCDWYTDARLQGVHYIVP